MSMSLREQLLQAGLGAKKTAEPQRARAQNNTARQRQAAQAAKAAREAESNRRRQEQVERKARWMKIKALIEQHRLPKLDGDEYFNFIDRQKVRRIGADAPRREQLIRGELAIVRCEGRYDVVPADVAAAIRGCDQRAVVALERAAPAMDGDDPYKDYVVPDDLRW